MLAKAKRDGFTWDVPPAARAARGTKERTQRPRIKKWNHGAPLSKKPQCPGIGRGNHPNSKQGGRQDQQPRPQAAVRPWGKKDGVLTTVPIQNVLGGSRTSLGRRPMSKCDEKREVAILFIEIWPTVLLTFFDRCLS